VQDDEGAVEAAGAQMLEDALVRVQRMGIDALTQQGGEHGTAALERDLALRRAPAEEHRDLAEPSARLDALVSWMLSGDPFDLGHQPDPGGVLDPTLHQVDQLADVRGTGLARVDDEIRVLLGHLSTADPIPLSPSASIRRAA
jgi:hypothetical protein